MRCRTEARATEPTYPIVKRLGKFESRSAWPLRGLSFLPCGIRQTKKQDRLKIAVDNARRVALMDSKRAGERVAGGWLRW